MCAMLISKTLRLARVKEGSHSFTCQPHVYPFIWNEPSWFYPTPLQPQSITALWQVLIFHPAEGRRLSWPGWLGEILRWFPRLKKVTRDSSVTVLAAAAGNRIRDHPVASPTTWLNTWLQTVWWWCLAILTGPGVRQTYGRTDLSRLISCYLAIANSSFNKITDWTCLDQTSGYRRKVDRM